MCGACSRANPSWDRPPVQEDAINFREWKIESFPLSPHFLNLVWNQFPPVRGLIQNAIRHSRVDEWVTQSDGGCILFIEVQGDLIRRSHFETRILSAPNIYELWKICGKREDDWHSLLSSIFECRRVIKLKGAFMSSSINPRVSRVTCSSWPTVNLHSKQC